MRKGSWFVCALKMSAQHVTEKNARKSARFVATSSEAAVIEANTVMEVSHMITHVDLATLALGPFFAQEPRPRRDIIADSSMQQARKKEKLKKLATAHSDTGSMSLSGLPSRLAPPVQS